MAKLTPKRAAFCREYLRDLCATQAALRAGFAEAGARTEGARLLANADIQAEVSRLMAERSARVEVSADDVVRELLRIARGDMRELATWGPDGVRLKPSGEIPDDAAMMVESVAEGPHGVRIKTKPAVRALELLGRHCGMFHDRMTVDSPDRYAGMSDAELDAELDRFVRARDYIRRGDSDPSGPGGPAPPPSLPPAPAPTMPAGPESAGDDGPSAAPRDLAPDPMRELADMRRQVAELTREAAADPDPAADEAWKAEAEDADRRLRARIGPGPLPDTRPLGPPEEWGR